MAMLIVMLSAHCVANLFTVLLIARFVLVLSAHRSAHCSTNLLVVLLVYTCMVLLIVPIIPGTANVFIHPYCQQ